MKNTKGLLLACVLLSIFLVASVSAINPENGPRIKVKDGTSSNWAGYAVETNLLSPQNSAVNEINATWIVASVDCSKTPSAYAAFWLGIDGYSSGTVEQIGTDSDCYNGVPQYYAWYEMYPKFPVNLKMKISPGDVIFADVKFSGNNKGNGNFVLTIIDKTSGIKYTTTQKSNSAKRSSVEWIAEAPWSSGVLPLADFGIANFNDAQVNINGISGSILNNHWQYDAIDMVGSSDTKAKTSALSNNGKSFSVTWLNSL